MIVLLTVLSGCSGEFSTSGAQIRAAEAEFDPVRLQASLSAIEAWHVEHGTGLDGSLESGASAPGIEDAFSDDGCRPSDELKALWSWRNGEDSAVAFVWYHDFLSLEEAQADHDWLNLNPLVAWDPRYIPVFSFDGEWYAAYCGPGSDSSGPIVHFSLEDEPRIVYVNLSTFLATMAETLQSGAVGWQDEGMAEDIAEVYRVHQMHNPGYAFPYHVP